MAVPLWRRLGKRLRYSWKTGEAVMLDFFRDDTGATSIEYALIAGLLSIVIYGAVQALGANVVALWASVVGIF